MMCACDEDVARAFLAHQLQSAHEYETGVEYDVTLGFQPRICTECRGQPPVPAPKAETYGRTSKFQRYYWRELYFEPRRRFMAWAQEHSRGDDMEALLRDHRDTFDQLQASVTDELREAHKRRPKYRYEEESQSEVIARNHVEVIELSAVLLRGAGSRGVRLRLDGVEVTPEFFAESYFRGLGYDIVHTESVPFHALFAVLLWPCIQDQEDDFVREVFFGDRQAAEERLAVRPPMVSCLLPSDFGSPPYAHRRGAALDAYFAGLPTEHDGLLREFDRLVPSSFSLRQYLWAHRVEDVQRARMLLEVLGVTTSVRILRYLVDRYWDRYLGWPDLVAYRASDYLFVEVKASRDSLSEDQKRWIRDNSAHLHLPFKILKIHAIDRR